MFRAQGFELLPLRSRTLPPADHTNCVIAGRQAALIIDPGSPFKSEQRRLLKTVRELPGLMGVMLTHHHGDHTGGAAALCGDLGLPLFAHPETLDRLERPLARLDLRPIEDGQRVQVDPGLTLEMLFTPGHAPGHICPWDPGQRVLVSGDMVLGAGTTLIDPNHGDMALYLASLTRLRALEPRVILPAHGPVIDKADLKLKRLITHRKWREWKVMLALEPTPVPLAQITAEAYEDLPSPLLWPLALRSTEAHLIKLEQEGQAVRTDAGRWQQAGKQRRRCARRGP